MAQSLVEAELLAACSSLGYSDGTEYYREPDCIETIKDLIRYLRRDDDSHQIRRALGESKVLETDLIPIIRCHSSDKELFDVTLRLLVNLTNPVLLLFKEELPEEKLMRQQYMQMIRHQQIFKTAFAEAKIWNVLVGRLGEILSKDWEDRDEEEKLVIERILILVRNVLAVASSPEEEKRTDDDASIHDQVLWGLHLARFEDLILYISSSSNEQDLCMHIIEIISLMLKEQDATQLAHAGLQRSQSEKQKDEKELLEIRKREALVKQQKVKKHYSARHSRFGGTYYVVNMKSISDRDVIAHKHISDIKSLNFDSCKRSKKVPKNRMPIKDVDMTRRSTLAIRLFLQEFCIEFLNGAFNNLMYVVKDNLNRAKAQEHDESYYMWAIKFFLEFNRNHKFRVELITETLNIHTFHYIQTSLEAYYETMTTDKKKIPLWSRRMHKALKAYQELILTLSFMDRSSDKSVCESSKILKSKLFYVVEYRELVLTLLQNYDELKMSKNYLKDLVETTHAFLKLLEGVCGKQRHLVVQKRSKNIRKNKNRTSKLQSKSPPTEEELISQWEEKSDTLLQILGGETGENLPPTFPFDPVSELPEEEQKEIAMKRINSLLRDGVLSEAVSLLRSSREIWPEGDIFGASGLGALEELLCLRMIFMANINDASSFLHETELDTEEKDSDDVSERGESQLSEQEFDFIGFVRRFSHIKVMQAYALLFKSFFQNTDHLNHCILKMFHRLAWDCKIVAIFFQASIFRTFQMILNMQSESPPHSEAVKFVKFILKKFIEVSEENKKVFIELLFWKSNRDALEIECGYNQESSNRVKQTWTKDEENEIRMLYEEFKESLQGEKDIVDLIRDNLINQNRTRRMVIQALKNLHLIENIQEITRKTVRVRGSQLWSKEEETELRNLVEEYRDAVHPIARIIDNLSVKRSKKKVIEKILELDLVDNIKDLQKKKTMNNDHEASLKAAGTSEDDHETDLQEIGVEDANLDVELLHAETFESPSNNEATHPIHFSAILQNNLNTALKNGFKEAIDWIADLIEETSDEREKDGDLEPIPVVPVTENCTDALENESFLRLLKAIGIRPPQNHQEMFWRIPSTISVENLRKSATFLRQGTSEINKEEKLLEPDYQSYKIKSKRLQNGDSQPQLDTVKRRRIIQTEYEDDLSTDASTLRLHLDTESTQIDCTEQSNEPRNIVHINDADDDDDNNHSEIQRRANIIDDDSE